MQTIEKKLYILDIQKSEKQSFVNIGVKKFEINENGLKGWLFFNKEAPFVNADDSGAIFAKPQELGSKNLYAYCDNNPVVRQDYAGEL